MDEIACSIWEARGMRRATADRKAERILRAVSAAVSTATMAETVTHEPGLWFMVGPRVWAHFLQLAFWSPMLHLRRLLEPIKNWPIIFLIAHVDRARNSKTQAQRAAVV
jgi:hypothetical protein